MGGDTRTNAALYRARPWMVCVYVASWRVCKQCVWGGGGGGAACGVRFVGTVLDTDENTRPLFVALECVHRGNG